MTNCNHSTPAPSNEGEWQAAVAAYEAATARYNPHGPSEGTGNESEEELEALWEAFMDAWRDVMDCPAPDLSALAYKLNAHVDLAHSEQRDDRASNPATLLRMLQDGSVDGPRNIVRLMQDVHRLAGLSHACLASDLVGDVED